MIRLGIWITIALCVGACTLPVRDRRSADAQRVTPREERATPRERGIGVLAISGPNVIVAGRPATNGMVVNEGEEVATGPNSSAVISYFVGGSVQLDENTDPISFKRIQAGLCILVKLFSGQAWVETEGACGIRVETPDASADIHSKVNVVVTPERTGFTVISGRLIFHQANLTRPIPVTATQNIIIQKGQTRPTIAKLSQPDLSAKIAWRSRYVVPRIRVPLQPVPGLKPAPSSSVTPKVDRAVTYPAPATSIKSAPATSETSPATSDTTTIKTPPATSTTIKKLPAELPPPENLRVVE